jgi:hypothetical protein
MARGHLDRIWSGTSRALSIVTEEDVGDDCSTHEQKPPEGGY